MNDERDDDSFAKDDDLPLSITHSRYTIVFDGQVAQDYRFLNYRFNGPSGDITARAYLDDIWEISILGGAEPASLPKDVMAYLQRRFNVIKMLGGPDGYLTIWQKPVVRKG